ncbi:MAG: 50S ribosomal protein L35 [Candidatus Acidiferrales bacterium]
MAKTRKIKLKLKTHRGAAKRFKVTSTGKIMRARAWKRHFTGTKRPKRMRHLRKSVVVNPADAAKVRRMLPYS